MGIGVTPQRNGNSFAQMGISEPCNQGLQWPGLRAKRVRIGGAARVDTRPAIPVTI
jgi:hypothetical protein